MKANDDLESQRLALIRAVRSLDEDKTVALPEKIQTLWTLLSATKSTRLHGVEENILRWIFKHMSGNTETAEQVRRYPLTWSILSYVFPQIPSQSLGRSLASLRFVSVLHQALGDITTAQRKPPVLPNQTNGIAPKKTRKRKRDDKFPSDIEELRTPEGCIKSATELLRALSNLIGQGNHRVVSNAPDRRVGAEHIKSLFSSSNEETRDIAARLILTCDRSLSVLDGGLSQDQALWINTITTLWNIRLHNKDDSLDFARHMYMPVTSILTRLRGIAGVTPVPVASDAVKSLWIQQLEQSLSAYFIRPARHIFAIDGNFEVIETALEVSKRNIGGSVIAMWDVVATVPQDSSNPKAKAEHSSWAQSVFKILLKAIQPLEPSGRNQVIAHMLDTAIKSDSVPSTEALRVVCREHALMVDETNWSLIAKIIACDADVFLMDDTLIKVVFDRISSYSNEASSTKDTIATDIILPIEDAFAKARNLSGFIQKWYDCLCESVGNSLDQAIWFDVKIRDRLSSILQSSLTSTQLMRVLERLDTSDANSGALLVVVDAISTRVTEEEFIRNADSKIFNAIFKDKAYENIPPSVLSLRWRIAGRMASWEMTDEASRLWKELKSTLKRVLKKGALNDPETFEAFSCCYKLWLAFYPEGKYEGDLSKLAYSFLQRLISEMKTSHDLAVFQFYIDLVFQSLPMLVGSPKQDINALISLIVDIYWHIGQQFTLEGDIQLGHHIRSLLRNPDCEDDEALIDALISQPLDALDSAETRSGWTQLQSLGLLRILSEFPNEVFSKGRRKRILSSWKKWKSAIATHASQDSQFTITMLGLLTKIMQQPTFYEDMEFDDLVDLSLNIEILDKNVYTLLEKLIDLTLRQMATDTEGSSLTYFAGASKFVKGIVPDDSSHTSPHMLLMTGLASVLHALPPSKPYISAINVEEITQKLEHMVQTSLSRFASDRKTMEVAAADESVLLSLSTTLKGAACVVDINEGKPITLAEKTVHQLEAISATYISKDVSVGWELRTFLLHNYPGRYDTAAFFTQLEQASQTVDEDVVYALVDVFVKSKDNGARDQLLIDLLGDKLPTSSVGLLLAVRRLIELHQGSNSPSGSGDNHGGLNLAAVYERLASQLSCAESLHHFKLLSDILALLLEKHANSMTQFNIEMTLSSVVHVCSPEGPRFQAPRAAGEVYEKLCKLVAIVLRRHRLRLRGHFPILLTTLHVLLSTLLAVPDAASSQICLPWLHSRLQSRHAERFTRLVTLICEPSAGSVARERLSDLDSATDAAKRAAGHHMFTILELYIKLQLEAAIPLDIRKALEPGVYAIIDITPQGCRRILNESLDANGRAIFRQLFADYKKFGKWTGV